MPNRTIYLPDDLDAASRTLGLNLSRVTQEAVRQEVESRRSELVGERVASISEQVESLELDWSEFDLATEREAAGER